MQIVLIYVIIFLLTLLASTSFSFRKSVFPIMDTDLKKFSNINGEKLTTKLIEQWVIGEILEKYDWKIRPEGSNMTWSDSGGPILVAVNIYLRSISKIDDVNMEYSAQFTFREEWLDQRLAYSHLLANLTESGKIPDFVILVPDDKTQQIWIPDTFFQNEKSATRHLIDKPNIMIRIYPDGQILYSVRKEYFKESINKKLYLHRLSMSLSCPMNLANYPLDRQICMIDLASYAYTTNDIIYKWKNENSFQIKDTVNDSLPSFNLDRVEVSYCSSKTTTGEYSCLRTKLYLSRIFSYYLLQLYLPSFMLVIVSWVSFWLDKSSVPGRVTLGVTTLLTITTQASGINAKLPPVSYTKAIDVWIGVCQAFIFGALLEFALINYASVEVIKRQNISNAIAKMKSCTKPVIETAKYVDEQKSPLLPVEDSTTVWKRQPYEYDRRHGPPTKTTLDPQMGHNYWFKINAKPLKFAYLKRWMRTKIYEYRDQAKKIDIVSRIIFPVGFFSFNICYWWFYLKRH